jgi:hypothetical protein
LKYIAIIESALRDNIVSSAGAWWIWQFMPWTAKKYWLKINNFVDERFDFEKSTIAATKYFKDLYKEFWDWNLVAAAYNRWENWLQRDIQSESTSWYYDLRLNSETSRYVFRILATKYLMQNIYDNFARKDLWAIYPSIKTKIIKIEKTDDLSSRAKNNWHSYYAVKRLNPRIIWNSLWTGSREIKVFTINKIQ